MSRRENSPPRQSRARIGPRPVSVDDDELELLLELDELLLLELLDELLLDELLLEL